MNSLKREDGVIWEEATIEHPLSTHSASIGTRWSQAGYLHALRMCAVLLVLLFTLGVGEMWGACNTYTIGWGDASGSTGTYSNFSATSGTVTNLLSFSSAKNSSATTPAYNADSKQLRLYYHSGGSGGSITITPVDGVTITGFAMTTATTPSVKYTVDGGSATSVSQSKNVYTVTGIAATSSLKIQNVNTSNTQLRISTIQISYTYEPTSLTNGTIGSTTARLSWSDSHSVGHYDVYRSTANTAPEINTTPTVSNTTNTYVDLTSLSASTTYYWWVRSNNSCKSAWIAGSSFTTSAAVSTYTIYAPNTAGGCSSIGSYTSDEGTVGSGTGTWSGYTTYSGITAGTTVTITATPESGYKFDGWTSGGYGIIMDDESNYITPTSTTSTTATFDMPSANVYIMECAFSTACDYQVTLTKGSESNGTFSLSSSNGSYDNCDANFVVTVSSISPSSGYGCTGVTATGGNSTVTGPDGSGNYTVTYTKGNSITSTVTANFAEKVKTPTFGVSGGTYNATQSVTLSCATDGATIYYTTDGSTPTTSSSVYSSAISVTTTNTTIKAIAAKSSMANSDVASATYVIQCATPVISPVTGTYTGAQSVTITCATDGASIYYTDNGGTPSSSSTSYSAFTVSTTKTIKAIAIKSGWTDSEIATSTITVQYGITWKVNGETWTPKTTTGSGTDGSSLVNSGTQWSALTLPTDPDPDEDGCGQKFIGWITNTITGELDKTDDAAAISSLDILNSGNQSGKTSETITTGTTFHAVFADYAE